MMPPRGQIGLPRMRLCRNQHNACDTWAKEGRCTQQKFFFWMSKFCCASCQAKLKDTKTGPDSGTAPKAPPATGGTATGGTATGGTATGGTATGGTKPVVAKPVVPKPVVTKPVVTKPVVDIKA